MFEITKANWNLSMNSNLDWNRKYIKKINKLNLTASMVSVYVEVILLWSRRITMNIKWQYTCTELPVEILARIWSICRRALLHPYKRRPII